jgi:hypothetical protein
MQSDKSQEAHLLTPIMMRSTALVLLVALIFTTMAPYQSNASPHGVGAQGTEGCLCHSFSSTTIISVEGLPERFESNQSYHFEILLTSDIQSLAQSHKGGFRLDYTGTGSILHDNESLTQEVDGVHTHTLDGSYYRNWSLVWVAPSDNSSTSTFVIFGNAVNGNNQSSGDGWSKLEITVPGVLSEDEYNSMTDSEFELVDIIILMVGLIVLGYLLFGSFKTN